ncbi:hypothetical protein SAMN00790413_03512 [Deinococcus hopiensis KR-140]|uniref:Uncharacterized protein n=1 Tax=Deinococcus hopiensis KR-140 TaxID=695939 RepID=A0A1W1UXC1_9DEIO|nr:hypothetical protein SAMN00790413_03512 [Deinococcus hopiensis KR-140]
MTYDQPLPTKNPVMFEPPKRRPYQVPQVMSLGPWTAVTLLYTVPIVPSFSGSKTNY